MRPGDFTVQESLRTLTLIKIWTSQGEESAVMCTAGIYGAVDSSLLSIILKTLIG